LHPLLEGPSKTYQFQLIDEKEADKQEGVHVHLVSLLGHCNIYPTDLTPKECIYTTQEQAVKKVRNLIDPLKEKNKICPVFVGEDRQATLMGGKQLPRNNKQHGRHLDAKAFAVLLKKYPEVLLLDCNPKSSRITFSSEDSEDSNVTMPEEFKDRILQLPDEKDAFDTTIALALYCNAYENTKYIGFGADCGPTNVYTRALSEKNQWRFVFMVPSKQEYDARMHVPGSKSIYRPHILSDCNVRKCERGQQAEAIIDAYDTIHNMFQ
jgi:hypothetical protein